MEIKNASLKLNFNEFIADFSIQLKDDLPGDKAHQKMESDYRRKLDAEMALDNLKQSAVLFLLFPNELGEVCATFILRQKNLGIHSNQISLPGGRFEESDPSYMFTALRETHEEIGVPSDNISVIGKLTDVLIPRSGFIVHPFIGYLKNRPEFKLQQEEVADIFEVKLSELFDPSNKSTYHITDSQGKNYTAPSYLISNRHLWGATAMMMAEVEEILWRQKI